LYISDDLDKPENIDNSNGKESEEELDGGDTLETSKTRDENEGEEIATDDEILRKESDEKTSREESEHQSRGPWQFVIIMIIVIIIHWYYPGLLYIFFH
jgi:hypothetical protein